MVALTPKPDPDRPVRSPRRRYRQGLAVLASAVVGGVTIGT